MTLKLCTLSLATNYYLMLDLYSSKVISIILYLMCNSYMQYIALNYRNIFAIVVPQPYTYPTCFRSRNINIPISYQYPYTPF